MIRAVHIEDAADLLEIYNHYIQHTTATFDECMMNLRMMEAKIRRALKGFPFWVYELSGKVVGYSSAGVWRNKSAFRFAVETSLFVSPCSVGNGIGRLLYEKLISDCKECYNFSSLIACVTSGNVASEKVHQQLGFDCVGTFPKVGYKFDQWLDVEFWMLKL